MPRTRVKFCGLTTIEDSLFAAQLGVDAIGFVFVNTSIRYIHISKAKLIKNHLPPFVTTVALFLNANQQEITEVITELKPDLLQFHGSEPTMFCDQFNWPYIKAISGDHINSQTTLQYKNAKGLLLDSHQPGQLGGQGRQFNWDNIPKTTKFPLIVAGGLTASNIGTIISYYKPYGIDVSSGIETKQGIKDQNKMRIFMQAVNQADQADGVNHY